MDKNDFNQFPVIESTRLTLKKFTIVDAPAVVHLAGDKRVSATAHHIPYPLTTKDAEYWIVNHRMEFEEGTAVHFAVYEKELGHIIGYTGMSMISENRLAEVHFWLGAQFWGLGYCTEAVAALTGYAFAQDDIDRLYARTLGSNPAAARVLEKNGFIQEGRLRRHIHVGGVAQDLALHGLLREDYAQATQTAP